MPLGIEPNSIAPQLIAQSGKMLSQNIREIGQQVQGAILEVNTRKDLARMAQEIQAGAVIPQSDEFPMQAVELGARHPLAIQDPRGQMALNILGKSHGTWQAGKLAEARMNPYRSMTGGGIYNASTGEVKVSPTAKPVSVNRNARLTDPITGEVIVDAEALPEKGFNLAPGSTRYDAQGNPIVTAPKPTGAASMTEYQSRSLKLRERAERRTGLKTQIAAWEKDMASLDKAITERRKAGQITPEVTEWQKRFETTKELRDAAASEIAGLDKEPEVAVEPELGAVPPNAVVPQGDVGVLPAQGTVAPAVSNTEFVLVFDPSGKPGRIRASQLESALANGYKRR
jgi:hypothetical protein